LSAHRSDIGRLLARAVIGGLFVGHGTQKLFGWFGGPGRDRTEQMMEKLEMHPPRAQAILSGATETTGGALLAAGLATPLAAAGLIGVMVTAIRKVHLKNGLWVSGGGFEYNLVLIAALLTLVDGGPGDLSLDRALRIHDTGPGWALASLGLGAATSAAVIEAGRRLAARRAAAGQPGHAAGATGTAAAQASADSPAADSAAARA
jgi:putative oxidoreductase